MKRGKCKSACGQSLKLFDNSEKFFETGAIGDSGSQTDVDVVLMRQDPPFDMAYITATHLLENVARKNA